MANPRLQHGPQMRFSQGNQPIEALPANGPDYSFANRIGLWTSRWRFQHRDAELRDRHVKMVRKDTVTIVKQVFVTVLKSNGLTQLLQRPGSTRLRCDVAMDQAPAAVLESSRRRSFLTCAPLRTGQASWPRIRLKHGESPSFQGAGTRSSLAENLPLAIRNRR